VCDLAEYLIVRAAETNDALRIVAALGGNEDYDPPASQIADALETTAGRTTDPATRRAQVLAFALAAGGG